MLPNNNAIIFLFSYLPLETQIVNNQLWGDLARWQNCGAEFAQSSKPQGWWCVVVMCVLIYRVLLPWFLVLSNAVRSHTHWLVSVVITIWNTAIVLRAIQPPRSLCNRKLGPNFPSLKLVKLDSDNRQICSIHWEDEASLSRTHFFFFRGLS